jgi:signal transduction histidine kinase
VLVNIVGNAIKFTDRGEVRITVLPDAAKLPGGIEVRVDDSGIGIPAIEQDKLFGAFSRVGKASARTPAGTGLGLHLSPKLAALLGGRIVFSSESGKVLLLKVVECERDIAGKLEQKRTHDR